MSEPTQILLVDDETHIRKAATQTLELGGYRVKGLANAEAALALIDVTWPGVLITDIKMPGMDGLSLLRRAREIDPDLPVIMVTGHGDIDTAVAAMRDGAYDFVEKPFAAERLLDSARRALDKRALTMENRSLRRELDAQAAPGPRLIGNNAAVRKLRSMIAQLADTDADVLIHGDTGTGKEMVARTLHEQGRRRDGNFVAINCGAVPEHLIESELFGHEAGAFTDARKQRIGKFEHANGGTLFLDEIEIMPAAVQVRLLRVLQERCVERLGSNEAIPLDLRVVAATKTDLRDAADRNEFREDLYYRLNIVELRIPPLRERRDDIPLLFHHFLIVANARYGKEMPMPDAAQMQLLTQRDWPGNVRELRNIAERYALLGQLGDASAIDGPACDAISGKATLPQQVECFERSLIEQALAAAGGNLKAVMEGLGLPRKTLSDKMRKYGLDKGDFS